MARAIFSKAPSSLSWLLTFALSACAVAQGGPPGITGGGDNGLGAGGSFAESGAAGSSVSASGTGFGASGSTGIAGTSGTGSSAFGGTTGVGGSVGTAGSSSFGGIANGGNSSTGGAGGKGAAGGGGSGAAGSGSAGTSSASCSVSMWSADKVYQMGDKASKNGMLYTAAYYTQNNDPTDAQNCCGGGKAWASSTACN